ncbi:hypothetical protein H5410_037103 [Solanum commersonii]|uniref:Uncharacterized protein n=1 Tax=Solanum commersonii TaxID=4109 RepID=A0A9J5Y7J0_SOLCO|nr:hypothetical protein H5410_037103 [Solanum commersonii]
MSLGFSVTGQCGIRVHSQPILWFQASSAPLSGRIAPKGGTSGSDEGSNNLYVMSSRQDQEN